MWRCSVLKGVHQETELFLGTLGGKAENLEHLGLQFRVVDTDTASADFDAVAHHVVGISTHSGRLGIEHGDVLVHRVGERMVHSHEALFLVAPFEHGELGDPKQGKLVLVTKTEAFTHL